MKDSLMEEVEEEWKVVQEVDSKEMSLVLISENNLKRSAKMKMHREKKTMISKK